MFEFLFKYPASVFGRGQFVLLGSWPVWILATAILLGAGLLFWHVRRNRGMLTGARPLVIWLLETGLLALALFLLWHPALSVATLKPQQNVVAVLVDDSRSMAIRDGNATRLDEAEAVLRSGLLDALGKRFQVHLYRMGQTAQRIRTVDGLKADESASRLGDSLRQVLDESATLPLGAVVLLSDGADNSGGIDLETVSRIRRQRVPVHTIGFGREHPAKDIEIADVELPARSLAEARLSALVTFRQYGFSGRKARMSIREGGRALASLEVVLKEDGATQSASLVFNAGEAGPKNLQVSIEPLAGEENGANNMVNRLVQVEASKPRILYVEGEPRWEFKFIRRAAEEDRRLQLVSMLRTTQNKIYRQGISGSGELEGGFPTTPEELFAYQGLIVGSVEAGYFTAAQQEMIREFAGRRGGGVLFLGGRFALAEGGWGSAAFADLIPTRAPAGKGTFHRDQAGFERTAQGRENAICRLEDNPDADAARWKKMPPLANYNEVGAAKPGAAVLLEVNPAGGRRTPLLAVENYGRGRTALFATAGSWRWAMWQDHADKSHRTFWQQLLRYLVSGTPDHVSGSTPRPVLSDESRLSLRAEVRDKAFKPMANATVEAHIVGPAGVSATVELTPQALEEGVYTGEWAADKPGAYVTEIVAKNADGDVGRDVVMFRREDGVAENFRTGRNREILEKLAAETGGRFYEPSRAGRLAEDISYSEAGITVRETRDLWDMPIVFLLALMLRGSEWLLRRKWGVV